MKLLFLDTETTGNMPGEDRLVAVAYKVGEEMVHELFRAPRPITIDAMATHHITQEMVDDKETFEGSETKKALATKLVDHILVAHSAAFDIAMLEAEGLTVPQFICTLKVAKALDADGKIPRYAIQYLRYYWKLEVLEAVAHSADGDVLVLEALFNKLRQEMLKVGDSEEEVIKRMLEMSTKPSLVQRLHFGKYRGEKLTDLAKRDPGYLEWLLTQKESALADGTGRYDDADMIYTLRQCLGRSTG